MTAVPIFEAKNKLPFYLHLVESGETVQITRHGKPVARLVAETECEQKSEGQLFMDKVMAWREAHPDCYMTQEEEDELYRIRHTVEPPVRHPEDIDFGD